MSRRRPSLDADVTVLGAGAAGISAARELADAGLRVIVLEARSRIGGRVFTRYKRKRPVEMGAEFIHGHKSVTAMLAKQYGLTLEAFPVEGCTSVEGVLLRDRVLQKPPATVIRDLRELAANLHRENKGGMSVGKMLELSSAQAIIDRYRLMTKTFVERLISNDFGVDASMLTIDAFIAPDVTGYEENFRIQEGYGELFRRMGAGMDIRFHHPARVIDWSEGYVKTYTPHGIFLSNDAVITIPIGVLQNGDVEFEPALPRRTREAIDGIDPGAASKTVMSFHPNFKGYPFWPANMGMVASDRRSQLWWETKLFRGPAAEYMLTNLTAGSECRRLALMSATERVDHFLSQLQCIFSKKKNVVRRSYEEIFDERHWAADRYSRGAYSAAPEDASRELVRRIGPLRFAGEAVGTWEPGNVSSVHGAIASGRYAASKILEERSSQ